MAIFEPSHTFDKVVILELNKIIKMESIRIKLSTAREREFEELPSDFTRIKLPNGDEYRIQYDHALRGLIINKSYSESEQRIVVCPRASNEIMIK